MDKFLFNTELQNPFSIGLGINPSFPEVQYNYTSTLAQDWNPFKKGLGMNPYQDYSQKFLETTLPIVKSVQVTTGLSTYNSRDPVISAKGLELLNNGLNSIKYLSLIKPVSEALTDLEKAKTKAGNIGAIIGAASDLIGGFLSEKDEYSGEKGNLTLTLDLTYDAVSDAAMAMGPWGMLVGGIMKAGSTLGKGVNALGGGTDGMTNVDAILGSSFLNLTPFGLVNGFGGKKADTITRDNLAAELVGSSYTGTMYTVNDALTKSGKKYGLFSSGARKKANQLIAEAKRLLSIMSDIADEATDRFAVRNSMAAINGNRRAFDLLGGYNQSNIRVGKEGMRLLNRAKLIVKLSLKLQTGGVISDPFEVYLLSLPLALRDSTNFRVRDYWEYNGRPKNFDEARKKGMFEWKEDFDESGKSLGWSWHAFTVAKNPNADEYDFMKSSSHPTVLKEIDWYNSDKPNAIEFRKEYELLKVQPYYKYVKRKTPYKDVPAHKEGGSIIELISLPTEILLVDPNEVPEFQQGGSINVIPDGALHARKHNMDMEGITKKGIPVVAENKDGSVEQQAEIEKEEIIFRLEVTKKLEELEKKFYNEETSKEEKNLLTLEAGKLLVEEILHNTVDNTNNLL